MTQPKFAVRRNSKLNRHIYGEYLIIDPSGYIHADGFDSKMEAIRVCRDINTQYENADFIGINAPMSLQEA